MSSVSVGTISASAPPWVRRVASSASWVEVEMEAVRAISKTRTGRPSPGRVSAISSASL